MIWCSGIVSLLCVGCYLYDLFFMGRVGVCFGHWGGLGVWLLLCFDLCDWCLGCYLVG